MSRHDVVIIGAGVIGCSIAYHLARQGVPSQIIERDSIAARASGKAWGVFIYPPELLTMEGEPPDNCYSMPVGSMEPWLELFWLGYHRLPDVALDLQERGKIDIGYGEVPHIFVAFSKSDAKDYQANLSFLRSKGYHESRWLDTHDIRAIYPDITPLVEGGWCVPGLVVEPYRYTLGLAQAAEKMGADIRQGEVVGFRHRGNRVISVTLSTGTEVRADVVVLAMGAWSAQATSWLGYQIPIVIIRDECLRLQMPSRLPPYILTSPDGLTVVPTVNGEVILGHSELGDLLTSLEVSLTTEDARMVLIEEATDLMPTLNEARLVEHRGDFLCYSPPPKHIQPVLGRLPEWENVYIATRCGGMGIMLSLGVGQVMAGLIMSGGRIPDTVKTMMEILSPARL